MIFLKQYLQYVIIIWSLVVSQYEQVYAFTTLPLQTVKRNRSFSNVEKRGTTTNLYNTFTDDVTIDLQKSFILPDDEIHPLLSFNKESGKEKCMNAYGIIYILASILTLPIWWIAMTVTEKTCEVFPDLDPNRSVYDTTGKIWAKAFLTMTNSYPTCSGDSSYVRDKNQQKGCLYVANHASWLDIPVLCTVLSPVFKFIAKGELLGVPCIGKQLKGGNHILIDREDRRSQLRTFKDGVSWLNKGVPIMAFPEGKRSHDGRLMEFKGGIFSMAVKAQVPIIPISISNTHAVMPSNALFPFQAGAGKLHVHIHPPIEVEGKTEGELSALVRDALLSKMPADQHPIETSLDVDNTEKYRDIDLAIKHHVAREDVSGKIETKIEQSSNVKEGNVTQAKMKQDRQRVNSK